MKDRLNLLKIDLICVRNAIENIADQQTNQILTERYTSIQREIRYLENPWEDVDEVIERFREEDYASYSFYGTKAGRFIDYIKYLKSKINES